jgi:hypothetical protein
MALAVATMIVIPLTSADDKGSAKGGGQKLIQSKPVKTLEDLSAVKPADMMVMSCPKCKNVTVSYVEMTFKAMEPKDKVKTVYTCPSCNIITVEGHGKAKHDVVTHVCSTCGSKEAFCCVVQKGTGTHEHPLSIPKHP